jgi:DNA-binding transcriptional ArsR family regulator
MIGLEQPQAVSMPCRMFAAKSLKSDRLTLERWYAKSRTSRNTLLKRLERAKKPPSDSAPLFAALGDETWLRLVHRLRGGGALSLTEFASDSDVTRQAITKHLHVLENAGLVQSVRSGRQTLWELTPGQLRDAQRFLDEISDRWDQAIGRLKGRLEK